MLLKIFSNLSNVMILRLGCICVLSKPTCLKLALQTWVFLPCRAVQFGQGTHTQLCGGHHWPQITSWFLWGSGSDQMESDIVDCCLEVLQPNQGKLSEIHQESWELPDQMDLRGKLSRAGCKQMWGRLFVEMFCTSHTEQCHLHVILVLSTAFCQGQSRDRRLQMPLQPVVTQPSLLPGTISEMFSWDVFLGMQGRLRRAGGKQVALPSVCHLMYLACSSSGKDVKSKQKTSLYWQFRPRWGKVDEDDWPSSEQGSIGATIPGGI